MNRTRPASGSSALLNWIACLLVVFLVLFPKGGVRLAGLPLTWGYLILMFLFPVILLIRLLLIPLIFPVRTLMVTGLLVPMQALFIYAGVCYGTDTLNGAFSTFVNLFIMPWMFLLLFAPFYPKVDPERLRRWFTGCVFYAAAWGIFLFVLHPITGHFIEIPYLTVNASDYGQLEGTKSIARGFFYKLISTYNNGNIYGVATLILLPVYTRLEASRARRITVRLALLLTLSRTVWVGVVLNEVLSLVPPLFRQIRTFPVLFLGEARRRFVAVLLTLTLVFGAVLLVTTRQGAAGFLFDRTLGNRTAQVDVATAATFLPERPLYGFAEVLYASAAEGWGILGLFAFTLIMFSPLLMTLWAPEVLGMPVRRAALKGLLLYSVMAASDGAFNFIPVMAFYWFIYAVFLNGWPGTQRQEDSVYAPSALPSDPLPGLASA